MMRRREFLALGAAACLRGQEKPPTESVTATATQDTTPRVGIVLSSYQGSEDHDGEAVKGLADPRPVDADLTAAQMDGVVRKAIELGGKRRGELASVIGPEDWVVIKTDISACYGLDAAGRYVPGAVTDLRVVRSLIAYMVEHKLGQRFTIAEGSGQWQPIERAHTPVDGWSTDWGGAFGGLSYKSMVAEFSRRHPNCQFDLADLNFDESIEMPVPGGVSAKNNPNGMYYVPATIQQCDKLISVAPLKTHPVLGASLSLGNYWGIAPGARYGFPKDGLAKLGAPAEVLVDLFSFHPADYAILGGSRGLGNGQSVHHNVFIAGANAVAVDAVAAAVMGFNPESLKHLELAELNGFGIHDTDSIWVRGNEIEEARHPFPKPVGRGASDA